MKTDNIPNKVYLTTCLLINSDIVKSSKRQLALFIACLILQLNVQAQNDSVYVRSVVDTLSSPFFHGRGYTYNGMQKAAMYLQNEFQQLQLLPLSKKGFLQPFEYSVNMFPGDMKVWINKQLLKEGEDYIISPESKGIRATCLLQMRDSSHFINEKKGIVVALKDKLTWSVAAQANDHTTILLDKKQFPAHPKKIKAHIENRVVPAFEAYNVCGYIKGTVCPDSIIFITAHYDHLGGMGKKVYFPGANDNAAGVGLLLALAKYYSTNPPPYSVGFICFAGEEAGLRGSEFFIINPLVDLKNIRFLINLDLVGTGEEGITVVNATEHPAEFEALKKINATHHYLTTIKALGKTDNSDHYWFVKNGVPAFFIHTNGGSKAYHDVFDRSATLSLNETNDLAALLKEFIKNSFYLCK